MKSTRIENGRAYPPETPGLGTELNSTLLDRPDTPTRAPDAS